MAYVKAAKLATPESLLGDLIVEVRGLRQELKRNLERGDVQDGRNVDIRVVGVVANPQRTLILDKSRNDQTRRVFIRSSLNVAVFSSDGVGAQNGLVVTAGLVTDLGDWGYGTKLYVCPTAVGPVGTIQIMTQE
jgi:hypothetical protein